MTDKKYPSLIAKNLDYLMAKHHQNPTSLAAATKQNQPTLHRIMTGESKDPRRTTLQPFADFFGVNVDDLRTKDLSTGLDSNVSPAPKMKGKGIPVISWVAAGQWSSADFEEVNEWRQTSRNCSDKSFALRIRGLSMYNPGHKESFDEGDIILVDPENPFQNGSLVISMIENTGEATFKKLYIEDGLHYLKALNPDWSPQIIHFEEPTRILGVVFEKQVDF